MKSLTIEKHTYHVGRHQRLGLVIFDPDAQDRVARDRVRLYVVDKAKMALFAKDLVRPVLLTPSEDVLQPARDYHRMWLRTRVTHCFRCKSPLNSVDFSRCRACSWIRCSCGGCGCSYDNHDRVALGARRNLV